MNHDDYESLPTTNFGINMTAGAIAGVLEHCIMYPLDSVKTRMQSLSPATARFDITTTMRNMIKLEGISRPIRGITAVIAGAGPAHALHFGCYEKTKELMTNVTSYNNVNYMVSGITATIIHDAVSNPTDVIKQRMQMYNSPYKSVLECMSDVYKREGYRAFYRSYSTQLVMNVPYNAIHFSTYEFFQNLLNQERRYSPVVHVIAGGASGACAAAITTPLDVIKTTLNTQEIGFTNGMKAAVQRIYSIAGPLGFYRGVSARVLYSMPATAICWSTYEFFKFYISGKERDQYKSSITGKNQLKPRDTHMPYVLPSTSTNSTHHENAMDDQKIDMPAASSAITTTITTTTTSNINNYNNNNNNNNNSGSSSSSSSNINKDTPTLSSTTHALAPVTSSTGSSSSNKNIKSVCDLGASGAGVTPTLNLHTRHTEVKNPFDRRFSS